MKKSNHIVFWFGNINTSPLGYWYWAHFEADHLLAIGWQWQIQFNGIPSQNLADLQFLNLHVLWSRTYIFMIPIYPG